MKQIIITAFIGIFSLIISACQKHDETPAQPSKVTFTLISPSEGSLFKKGDTVTINFQVSYISQLHGYTLRLTDAAQAQTYLEKESHVHGDHFEINEKWVDTLSTQTELRLELETVIDHDGNTANKILTFTSIP